VESYRLINPQKPDKQNGLINPETPQASITGWVIKQVDSNSEKHVLMLLIASDNQGANPEGSFLMVPECIISDNGKYYAIFKEMPSTLWDCIVNNNVDLSDWVKIVENIAKALRFLLKKLRIIHSDLKFANVLVDKDGRIYLTDYGLSVPVLTGSQYCGGTREFAAPEVLIEDCQDHLPCRDFWSIGIMIYRVLYGEFPWNEAHVFFPNDILNPYYGYEKHGCLPPTQWTYPNPDQNEAYLIKVMRDALTIDQTKRFELYNDWLEQTH